VSYLTGATNFCEMIGFKTCSVKLGGNLETGIHEMVDLSTGKFTAKPVNNKEDDIYSVLYEKDKLSIPDNGYDELKIYHHPVR